MIISLLLQTMNLQPLSIFLVKNGQGGDRVLFRYPYKVSAPKKTNKGLDESKNIKPEAGADLSRRNSRFQQKKSRHRYYELQFNVLFSILAPKKLKMDASRVTRLGYFPPKWLLLTSLWWAKNPLAGTRQRGTGLKDWNWIFWNYSH